MLATHTINPRPWGEGGVRGASGLCVLTGSVGGVGMAGRHQLTHGDRLARLTQGSLKSSLCLTLSLFGIKAYG
jgi:hypothetical protein